MRSDILKPKSPKCKGSQEIPCTDPFQPQCPVDLCKKIFIAEEREELHLSKGNRNSMTGL